MILRLLHNRYRCFIALMVVVFMFSFATSVRQVNAEDESTSETTESTGTTFTMLRAPSIITEIYLDGVNGDDTKDGSNTANAVKTFEKAKEIATANQSISTIWVTGMGTVLVEKGLDVPFSEKLKAVLKLKGLNAPSEYLDEEGLVEWLWTSVLNK